MYIELHAASAFSFLRGASLPEALVERAAALGYPALALLDADGVYGLPRFHKAATAAGIRPIVGAELTIDLEAGKPAHPASQASTAIAVLCESQHGYRNLCQLITQMKLRSAKGDGALALGELDGRTSGLVALVGRAALHTGRFGVGGLLDRLVGLFGRDRVYVDLQRHHRRDEEADLQTLVQMADAFRVPTLATNGVRFAQPSDRPLFDVLTCIHQHTDLAQAGRRLAPNAERYLKPPQEMAALFADMPGAVARTRDLAERHGIRPTKALGQNFLVDPNLARAIADLAGAAGDRDRHDCHDANPTDQ